jgi:hypothetical protein
MKTQIIKTYQASETTHRIQLAEINIRIEGISGSKDIDILIDQLRNLQEEIQEENFSRLVKQVDQEIENLLVNLHKGSVIGVPHVPEYKPNSQKANSDTISVGKNKGDRKPKKDSLSQACCNLCRYGIPGLRAFIKGTTLSDKDNPVDDPRSKYEQSRHCDE